MKSIATQMAEGTWQICPGCGCSAFKLQEAATDAFLNNRESFKCVCCDYVFEMGENIHHAHKLQPEVVRTISRKPERPIIVKGSPGKPASEIRWFKQGRLNEF